MRLPLHVQLMAFAVALLVAACSSFSATTPTGTSDSFSDSTATTRTYVQATPPTTIEPSALATNTPGSIVTGTLFPTATSVREEQSISQLSVLVAPRPANIPAYDRDDWRHWTDEDSDCQSTRQEVLIEESATPVTYSDSGQCRVAAGDWTGPYTGERAYDPSELDIDHMVPLANAHWSGGWAWSLERKRQYANDLSYEGHLIAAKASANRSKGSDGPEEWRPPDRGYWCQYAIDWGEIKETWELTASAAEAEALTEMLKTCVPTQTLVVVFSDEVQPVASPLATPNLEVSYGSCDAAEAAGEPRVPGPKGSGRGFPKDKVPTARDGDGDGVVCER